MKKALEIENLKQVIFEFVEDHFKNEDSTKKFLIKDELFEKIENHFEDVDLDNKEFEELEELRNTINEIRNLI